MGARKFKKKIKKLENQRMESLYVIYYLGKIPNMTHQGFREKTLHKKWHQAQFYALLMIKR
jgi:hypothetical protein